MFIRAVAHVLSKNKKIRAIIIGDGLLKNDLTYQLDRLNLSWTESEGEEADVVFAGWSMEIDRSLAGLDLVCLTSLNEGTPVSLIEAQAAGKPVVSTNVGGIQDILEPSAGFLSPPGDQDSFDRNLLRAIEEIDELKSHAMNGRSKILEKFSYKRLCSEMENLYDELLKTGNGQS
jgi:glycosyltransferase involved in cell wall biosynthesis